MTGTFESTAAKKSIRRAAGRLSALRVKQLISAAKAGLVADGLGLYLAISRAGVPSWVFRYRVDGGRERYCGLGPCHTIGLGEARDRALACRKLRLDGKDPIEERRQERLAKRLDAVKTMTFEQSARAYIAAHETSWKTDKHAAQWPATLKTYVFPTMGALPVQAIDTGFVMRAIEPIWTTKPETASRVRGRIEAVLDWASARGYRQGENPARWRGHLENLLPKKTDVRRVEHHAALSYVDLPPFMTALRQQEGVAARALEFAILTAARTGEVIGARWAEIDLAAKVWTVPAERMKAGKEHRVPLSDAALAILKKIAATCAGDFMFPGRQRGRPLSNTALLMTLRRMGHGSLTTHGFRSSFADWVSEKTAFAPEAREMALAHAVSDKAEAAYRRGDLLQKRHRLAAAWARYCDGLPPVDDLVDRDAAKVVPLRR